jgi:hypothetical protein
VAGVAVDGGSERRDLPIEGSVGVASPSRTTPPAGTPIARTELAIRITIVANMPGRRRCSGPRRRHPTCAEMVRADRVKEGRCSGNVLDGQALPEARAVRRGQPLDKRSLAITQKALGPNQPTVAALNNLAAQYRSQIHLHQLRSSILSWHGFLPCCRHLHPAQIECLMPQGHHAIRQLR